MYDKVEKNRILGIETIWHELCKPEVKGLQVEELDKVLEKNPY